MNDAAFIRYGAGGGDDGFRSAHPECEVLLNAQRDRLALVFGDGVDLDQWVGQFEPADRPRALRLVAGTRLVSQSELRRRVRSLHQKVLAQAQADGVHQLTYSRMYTAKSGDLISYYYRSANLIPATDFADVDALAARPDGGVGRALVLVDDYVGTGAQFLTEYYGREKAALFAKFDRVYLVVVAAHARARERFRRVAEGRGAEVAEEFIAEFNAGELDAAMAREALARAEAGRPRLIYDLEDEGFVLDEDLTAFLRKYGTFERNPRAPFGVAGLRATVAFFYAPPNGMPDLFWNSLGRHDGRALIPLFPRTEDVTNYAYARDLPADQRVWGGPRR